MRERGRGQGNVWSLHEGHMDILSPSFSIFWQLSLHLKLCQTYVKSKINTFVCVGGKQDEDLRKDTQNLWTQIQICGNL